jgi:single-strand DNA-binding protein
MGWHQTIIVGNLGGDPELKYLPSGVAVCNFNVAVSERWTDRQTNENREKTTWYRVTAWRGLAESCNTYLQKGGQVMVTGNISTTAYINKNGEAAANIVLTARDIQFLSRAGGTGQSQGGQGQGGQQGSSGGDDRASNYSEPPSTVDDIPF